MSGEEPSKVLHLRNVTAEVTPESLHMLVQQFGKVESLVLLRDKKQALIQMDSIAAASNVISYYSQGYAEPCGRRVYIKYSRHQELTGKAVGQGSGSVLLVSMTNPMYDIRTVFEITADVVYQIFAQHGQVEKIVVIQKQTTDNRQQALVQFDSHASAEHARTTLQGQTVFVGSSIFFNLDMQYSNLDDLIIKNQSNAAKIYTGMHASQMFFPQQMYDMQQLQQYQLMQQMMQNQMYNMQNLTPEQQQQFSNYMLAYQQQAAQLAAQQQQQQQQLH